MLTVGSCFSGIGGLELGLEWTGGFQTKWQIEIEPYAKKILEKHWSGVQRFSDITTVVNPPPVDVICGGFPCQDVSLAGARRGLEGKRSTLWGEMFRLVCETRPRWVVAENVPGLLSSDAGRFFGNILRDLASAGYDAEWGVLSAAGVGAPHLRRRIFIMAHTRRQYGQGDENQEESGRPDQTRNASQPQRPIERSAEGTNDVANAASEQNRRICESRFQPDAGTGGAMANPASTREIPDSKEFQARQSELGINGWWHIEPDVGRVAHGIPSRVDRLRCLGNAVVPQVAKKIGEMILKKETT